MSKTLHALNRTFLVIIGAFILPIFGTAGFAYYSVTSQFQNQEKLKAEASAQFVQNYINGMLDKLLSQAKVIADTRAVYDSVLNRKIEDLKIVAFKLLSITQAEYLLITDEKGDVLFQTEDLSAVTKNKTYIDAVQNALLRNETSEDLVDGTDMAFLNATVPIFNWVANGTITLGYSLNNEFAQKIYAASGNNVVILSKANDDDHVVGHSFHNDLPFENLMGQVKASSDADASTYLELKNSMDGRGYPSYFLPLGLNGLLRLLVISPDQNYAAYANRYLFALFILTVISLSLLIFAAYVVVKRFLNPINQLVLLAKDDGTLDKTSFDAFVTKSDDAFNVIGNSLITLTGEVQKKSAMAAMGQMAQQVAHDIRSPLAALTMVTSDLQELPEENRLLIRSAVQRIHDIANDLAGKKSKSTGESDESDELSLQLLSGIVDTLISEKRLQHRSKIGVEIDGQLEKSSYGLFAKIQPVEFKRVLSNLINNAVEGIGSSGRIDIKLFSEKNQIRLRVSDNGKGIPPEILPRLMQRGETHGKSGGSGLGLYHAKSSVEKWDGSVTIESTLGVGTTVTISLPLQDPPQWFVPQLELASQSTVVIVDDDNSIHQIWKGRFESSDPTHQIKLMHFSTPDEMSNWYRDQNGDVENIIFLCDYEFLGNEKTGLDIVRELKNQKNTILVTSRFEEEAVRKGCEKLGVRLIPKNLAGFVPLYLSAGHSASRARSQKDNEAKSEIDAVLIDDDDLVHMNWKMAAKRQDKIIRIYANPDTFWKEAMTLPKDIPIYVDSNLADGIKGEDVTWMMRKKGFSNLHLATGYDASQFDDMPWIKSIVGKAPPWR